MYHDQRILGDPARGDGHDANGVPGDCWKACIASLLGVENYDSVPHFALYGDAWWPETYRWVLINHGLSLTYWGEDVVPPHPGIYIGSGPSPRGDFYHAVIVDEKGNLIHDPHPSRAGVIRVAGYFGVLDPGSLSS